MRMEATSLYRDTSTLGTSLYARCTGNPNLSKLGLRYNPPTRQFETTIYRSEVPAVWLYPTEPRARGGVEGGKAVANLKFRFRIRVDRLVDATRAEVRGV